jgi:hypothetical protein
MATGAIVDVMPDDDGYDFTRDDGSSVYLLKTPETDQLAQQISSLRGGMTADASDYLGFNPAEAVMDAPAAPMAPPPAAPAPVMSVAPEMPPPEALASVNPGLPPPMPAGPPPMAPPGAPPPGMAPPGMPPGAAGLDPMQLAVLASRRQGSPGISQAQLQQKAAQGVEMPTGTEMTVEGAVPYDQELAAQRAMATDMGREARANELIDQRLALQQEANDSAELAQRIDAGVNPARQKLMELERSVEDDARHYRMIRNEVHAGKVDPGRLFRGPVGTIAAIASTLGTAMGAYGAILGRSQNFAQDMLQTAIDRDIQAQVDEYNRLGAYAENTYADLMKRYDDRDMARTALEGMQLEWAKAKAGERVARSKDASLQNNFQQWLAEDMFKEAENERAIREKSHGKHTQRIAAQVAYPVKPTGGGINYQKLFDNTLKLEGAQRDAALADATIAEKRAQAGKYTAEASGGAPEDRREFNKSVRAVQSAKADIEAIAKSHGYTIDPKTGKFEQTGSGFPLDLPDPTMGVLGDTTQVTKLHSDLTAMGVAFGRVVNDGGEPSADLARRLIPSYGSTSAPNDLVAQLESAYQGLQRKEAAISAGASTGARAQRAQEQRNVNVENATTEALPAPEEF